MLRKSIEAYLHGALHDGTISPRHATVRIGQKSRAWIVFIQDLFRQLDYRAWIYQEGKKRDYYVVEAAAKFLHQYKSPLCFTEMDERIAYIRGYFDSEGGTPRDLSNRMYIQFCQNNFNELSELKEILAELGIHTGKIHNPSHEVDPEYFRFYVSSKSHFRFMHLIGSWHPRKQLLFQDRMKI
jgi:intein-encoded DNA endonuclease-like protein